MKYYLAGPFWDSECEKFFKSIIKEMDSTKMSNVSETYGGVCDFLSDSDTAFYPGSFKLDFNKLKSTLSIESLRRVFRQVLNLDTDNMTEGLIVYPKGYDLGTMFELGYYLAGISGTGKLCAYREMRKSLIIKDPDAVLIKCIDKLVSDEFMESISKNYSLSSNKMHVSTGELDKLNNYCSIDSPFSAVALNVDNYKVNPLNSILSGYFYKLEIPFITYSCNGLESNVMMLSSSLLHIKLNKDELADVKSSLESKINESLPYMFWDNSYINKLKDIK